jgi:HK97 family phage major capsid protein
MSDFAELKGLVEQINPALVGLRADVEAVKNRDPLDDERFRKQAEFVADLGERLTKLTDQAKAMEAALNREDFGNSEEQKAAELHCKQFNEFLRGEGKYDGKMPLELRAMSTDVQPDGGYLVRPEFVNKVVSRDFETSPMRAIADVIVGSAKSIEMLIDDDEADAVRVGEGASGGETDTPEIGLKTITAHKYEAAPKVTTEMLQDAAFDVEGWLAGKVRNRIERKENTDFVTGTTKIRGFLTYPAWASAGVYERGKIEQRNLGSASALNSDGLIKLQGDLHEIYQPGAVWAMHRTTFAQALALKGADQYHFSPVLMRDGQPTMTMLGKPVRFMADMPVVAGNALAVAYADWRTAYTVYDRVGVIVLRDPYSSHGFVTYYTTKRTGGDVTSFDAIKIGKIAA